MRKINKKSKKTALTRIITYSAAATVLFAAVIAVNVPARAAVIEPFKQVVSKILMFIPGQSVVETTEATDIQIDLSADDATTTIVDPNPLDYSEYYEANHIGK